MGNVIRHSMRIKDLAHYARMRALVEPAKNKRKKLAWMNVEQILNTQMNGNEIIKIQVPKGLNKHGKTKEKEEVDD